MDAIQEKLEALLQKLEVINFDWELFLIGTFLLGAAALIIGAMGTYLFGKRDDMNRSVSSAIGILFVYAATIVFYSAGANFEVFIAPLPFIQVSGVQLSILSFFTAHYTDICAQIVSMLILAFLVNLIDLVMPVGKEFFSWLFLRCLTVVAAIIAHLAVLELIGKVLPADFLTYAPMILLGVLAVLLCVGALKLLVGVLLSAVNPLVGAFYTFFFATVIGKALTKAILTSLIISALVAALNYVGISTVSIAPEALVAYVPLLLVLLAIWYAVTKYMKKKK